MLRMGDRYVNLESGKREKIGSRSCFTKIKRLFKGHKQDFVEWQMERIKKFRMAEVIEDKIVAIIYQKFLFNEEFDEVNRVENRRLWDCYNLCKEILWNINILRDDRLVDQLIRTSPEDTRQQEVISLVNILKEQGNANYVRYKIYKLKEECLWELEVDVPCYFFLRQLRTQGEILRKYLTEMNEDKIFYQSKKIDIQF